MRGQLCVRGNDGSQCLAYNLQLYVSLYTWKQWNYGNC
jgi:hypothetical protein